MTEQTLLSAFYALQQRRICEWSHLDVTAQRDLLDAIEEVRSEIVRRDRGGRMRQLFDLRHSPVGIAIYAKNALADSNYASLHINAWE